jgi:hypothetical protein
VVIIYLLAEGLTYSAFFEAFNVDLALLTVSEYREMGHKEKYRKSWLGAYDQQNDDLPNKKDARTGVSKISSDDDLPNRGFI